MTTIHRSQFIQQFPNGIDLNKPGVAEGLAGRPRALEQLRSLADAQGVIPASSLGRAWEVLDSFDRNGDARTISGNGRAADLFRALGGQTEGTSTVQTPQTSSPRYSDAIARAATDRARNDRAGYAYTNAPTSPYPNLSGNRVPGQTRPSWLENNNKCNQFVGDALTQAGMRMPTYRMSNGTEHYVNAEKLPTFTKHFDRVTDPAQIRPGDVFVLDYPRTGESTAHTEVITGYDRATGEMKTTGAHSDGAYEMNRGSWLNGFSYDARNKRWEDGSGNHLYILRPKMPAVNAPAIRG